MKKIVDGKRYDTDTAELICTLECDAYAGAWDWHDTDLYRTRNGAFFLAGWGMGGSRWGQKLYDCNDYVKGEGLRPLTSDEALAILEQEGQTDTKIHRSELLRPISQSDGHDLPGLFDEFVPSVAAVIKDFVVGGEDTVR